MTSGIVFTDPKCHVALMQRFLNGWRNCFEFHKVHVTLTRSRYKCVLRRIRTELLLVFWFVWNQQIDYVQEIKLNNNKIFRWYHVLIWNECRWAIRQTSGYFKSSHSRRESNPDPSDDRFIIETPFFSSFRPSVRLYFCPRVKFPLRFLFFPFFFFVPRVCTETAPGGRNSVLEFLWPKSSAPGHQRVARVARQRNISAASQTLIYDSR